MILIIHASNQFVVPRSINYKSDEYLITSISGFINEKNPNVKTVKFDKNSKVTTIYQNAFSSLYIEEIYFPDSLSELKERWCNNTSKLSEILVSKSNNKFKYIDDKYLVGKTDINSDEFDNLLFVRRDADEISIPENIKIIGPFSFQYSNISTISIPSSAIKICEGAFYNCEKLIKVEISPKSNLQIIQMHFHFQKSKKFQFLQV